MIDSSSRIGLVLSALSVPLALGPVTAPSSAAPVRERLPLVAPECEASIDPSRVAVYEYPVYAFAELARPIGDGVEAAAPDESGIIVQSIEPAGSPTSFELALDTSEAEAGEWVLTLRGDREQCQGAITVVERTG